MWTFYRPVIDTGRAPDNIYGLMLAEQEFNNQKIAEVLDTNENRLGLYCEIFAAGTTSRQVETKQAVPLYKIFIINKQFPIYDFKELVEDNGFKEAFLPLPNSWLPIDVDGLITETEADDFLGLAVKRDPKLIKRLSDEMGERVRQDVLMEPDLTVYLNF